MTIQHLVPRLLTVAEYLEIEEIELGYSELVEGRVVVSPSPAPLHSNACGRICRALEDQVPPHLWVLEDLDVNLELAPAHAPGFSRRPDVLVVDAEAPLRVEREGGVIRASEVVLAVEVVSPGSVRTDNMVKRAEYADAGIPHYWIVDISTPVSLLACHLAGEFGYADSGAVTGIFSTTEPFSVEIDLDSLRKRRLRRQ